MNDKPSQQIFDSLLGEILSGESPPDLSKRIQAAWEAECQIVDSSGAAIPAPAHLEGTTPDSAASGLNAIISDGIDAGGETNDRPVLGVINPVSQQQSQQVVSSRWWRTVLSISAALVALLGGGVLVARLSTSGDGFVGLEAGEASGEVARATQDENTRDKVAESQIAGANSALNRDPPTSGGQILSLDDLPFDSQGSHRGALVEAQPASSTEPEDTPALDDRQIVDRLNMLLAELWNQADVQPASALSASGLVDRGRERLLNQPKLVAPATLSSNSPDTAEVDASDLPLAKMIGSNQFASSMASRWVELWLSQSALDPNSDAVGELQRFVESRIASGRDFNELPLDLLGGDLDSPGPTRTFIAALAGGGNHQLVQRIGTHFLNANMACVQCHDAMAKSNSRFVGLPVNQAEYWAMVATLKGVDAQGNGWTGQRNVSDRQTELFADGKNPPEFFDLLDGRMKSASAQLPSGSDWRPSGQGTPRRALARWISDSRELDLATSNRMWQFLVGKELVPQVVISDRAGMDSRTEMLQLLAQQYRASGHSLQRLAGWIAASQAFDRAPLEFSSQSLLLASDGEVERMAVAQAVFAAAPSITQPVSLNDSLALAVRWRDSEVPSVTLAQPVPMLDQENRIQDVPRPKRASQPSLAFAMHSNRVSQERQRFVQSLLNAKGLSWDERVEHVVLLNPGFAPTGRVQQLAKSLLQQHKGDSKSALQDLLWAVESAM